MDWTHVNWPLYAKLSGMYFFEFAVWGAWMPVLAVRLLGPLKMSGKQMGWIYATLPLASLVAPLAAGHLADRFVDAGWLLVAAHLLGAGLLLLAARLEKFPALFLVMLLYSLCYGATIPLANAMIFRHAPTDQQPMIFIWAPIAWALAGYMLTGLRQLSHAEGDGSDCLKFAALLSAVMGLFCLVLPATPPQSQGTPLLEALSMLGQSQYLVFTLVSLVVAGTIQFYFLGTAPFMQSIGIAAKNVPAAMACAQAVQAVATFFLLGEFYNHWPGPVGTLVVGAASWAVLYAVYVSTKVRWIIFMSQGLHGLAYVLFIIGGWMFVADVASKKIAGSAQALIFFATSGIGALLGTLLAGAIMDRSSVGGQFQWRKVFAVPLLCTALGALVLAAVVHDPVKPAPPPPAAAAQR
ncbi:MAG: MFS transporter [Thermoguttaceae bacterium]|jgi:MFS family permease